MWAGKKFDWFFDPLYVLIFMAGIPVIISFGIVGALMVCMFMKLVSLLDPRQG